LTWSLPRIFGARLGFRLRHLVSGKQNRRRWKVRCRMVLVYAGKRRPWGLVHQRQAVMIWGYKVGGGVKGFDVFVATGFPCFAAPSCGCLARAATTSPLHAVAGVGRLHQTCCHGGFAIDFKSRGIDGDVSGAAAWWWASAACESYVGWAYTEAAVPLGGLGPARRIGMFAFAFDTSCRLADLVFDIYTPVRSIAAFVPVHVLDACRDRKSFSVTCRLDVSSLNPGAPARVAAAPSDIVCGGHHARAPEAMAAPPSRSPCPAQAFAQGGGRPPLQGLITPVRPGVFPPAAQGPPRPAPPAYGYGGWGRVCLA
jgi:hypothetical protein